MQTLTQFQIPWVEVGRSGNSSQPVYSAVFVIEIVVDYWKALAEVGQFILNGLPGWVYRLAAERGHFQFNICGFFLEIRIC